MSDSEVDFGKFVPRFDQILARGLSHGLGKQDGQMCIEAAVCCALGLPHGDNPTCVAESVRAFKIVLNDSPWPDAHTRAKGLRALGIAQVGSKGVVDDVVFATKLVEKTIRVLIPKLFREVFPGNKECLAAAKRCEEEGTADAAKYAAKYAAKNAANAAKNAANAANAAKNAAKNAAANAAKNAANAANAAANTAANAAANAANTAANAAANAANTAANTAANAAKYAAANAAANAAVNAANAAKYAAANTAANAAANAAKYAAVNAANAAVKYLSLSAQLALEVLTELNSPGVKYI